MTSRRPRIALAHEWLTNWAGSERVVEQIAAVVRPDELVCSIVRRELAEERFADLAVRALWPTRLPGAQLSWSRYAPAMSVAWPTSRIRADALVVSSHFAAHTATVGFDGPSLVYFHTPARMLWCPEIELARLPSWSRPVVERAVLPAMRGWDARAAQGATRILANSTAVALRIRAAYGRDAAVVHPPVDVDRWRTVPRDRRPGHLLWVGRLVAYKRPLRAVEVARRLGMPLVMIGDGPEREAVRRAAPPGVEVRGHVSDDEMRAAMAGATAMIFPGEEDFGIAAVECLAAGVPVVAHGAGGSLDFVRPGVNGMLADGDDLDALTAAVADAVATDWDEAVVRASADPFSRDEFRLRFSAQMDVLLGRTWRAARLEGVA